jgi:hypothetical protein
MVLFIFKVISTYLNTFLKTVCKGFQRNSVQFGRHVFRCLQHPEMSFLLGQFSP